jgi:hypothetical protein
MSPRTGPAAGAANDHLPERPALPQPAFRTPATRHSYFRLPDDFPDWPISRAVAKRARVPLLNVLGLVLQLECLANRSRPRGSVAVMNVTIIAASLTHDA